MEQNYFRTFLLFGIWILILLYLRIPAAWKDAVWVLTALALFYQAYREHSATQQARAKTTISTSTFAENAKESEIQTESRPEASESPYQTSI